MTSRGAPLLSLNPDRHGTNLGFASSVLAEQMDAAVQTPALPHNCRCATGTLCRRFAVGSAATKPRSVSILRLSVLRDQCLTVTV
jgi:hypothetical protein